MVSQKCVVGWHGQCNLQMCECICHRKEVQAFKAAEEARGEAKTFELRWNAHQAVKRFDLKPNHDNTEAAIQALNQYIQQLNDTNDRGPE